MKKDFLSKVKGAILTKEEAKTISGGYTGPYAGNCSFIVCGGYGNTAGKVATPAGCPPSNLYYYKPNPSLYCVNF